MNLFLERVLTTSKSQSNSQFSAVFNTTDHFIYEFFFFPWVSQPHPLRSLPASLGFPSELLHEFLFLCCPSEVGLLQSHLWPPSLLTLHIPYGCSSVHLAFKNSKSAFIAQTLLSFRPSQFPWDQRISWDLKLSVLRLRNSQANQNESVTLETRSTF